MSFSRSGSSSTSRISPGFIAVLQESGNSPDRRRGSQPAQSAPSPAAATAVAARADAVAEQALFHRAQRLELLDGGVALLLLGLDRALTLDDLGLQHRGKIAHGRRGGRRARYDLEQL